ncbi:cytochrome P450 [Diaporthe sp. PMI_573]|nr:cytochrome P450 [Diaporthaceae sp. PMI_573]
MLTQARDLLVEAGLGHTVIFLFLLVVIGSYVDAIALWRKRPLGAKINGSALFLGNWICTIQFTFNGIGEIRKAYRKCPNQELFALPALGRYQLLVSHPQQIREMATTSMGVLSLNAALTDRLFEPQIMYGFRFGGIDPNNSVGKGAVKRALGTHLQELSPKVGQWVANGVESQLNAAAIEAGDFSRTVNLTNFVRAAVMQANSVVLFGEELASDMTFQKAATRYSMDGAFAAELSRQVPSFIAPTLGGAAMAWSGAMKAVGARVTELVKERLTAESEGLGDQFLDVTQFVIRGSRTPQLRSLTRISQQMVALLFATSHQNPLSVLWAITMLATHREYIQPLREEIEKAAQESNETQIKFEKLRLMDSFLRESARMHPIDGLGMNRLAIKDFKFSDGSQVPAGTLVAVPQHELLRDEQIYEDPDRFNGHRFYTPESESDPAANVKHTDVRWDFPYWGAPSHACPGRFYASELAKHMLIYLLKNYDFEIVNPNGHYDKPKDTFILSLVGDTTQYEVEGLPS